MNGRRGYGLWLILGLIGAACLLLILNHDSGELFGVESDNFASLVWYGIWGTLVGAAILPRAGKWQESVRNGVLWLAILLVLTTAYIYRYELQDIASRVTAGLVPGSPIAGNATDGRQQVTLVSGSGGQFKARGEVNGAPVRFLVDTGASTVVLTDADARAAGIDTSQLSYSQPVSTANGATTAARISLENLAIGAIGRKRLPAMVARPGALTTSLLGMSFLSTLQGFEFRGDRLILTD